MQRTDYLTHNQAHKSARTGYSAKNNYSLNGLQIHRKVILRRRNCKSFGAWIFVLEKVNRKIIVQNLEYCQQHKGLEIYAWVLMSNQLHAHLKSNTNNLSGTLRPTGVTFYTKTSQIILYIRFFNSLITYIYCNFQTTFKYLISNQNEKNL